MGNIKDMLMTEKYSMEQESKEVDAMYSYYTNDAIGKVRALEDNLSVLHAFLVDKGLQKEFADFENKNNIEQGR